MLSQDYFSVPEEQIKGIESVMTVVDGKVVYAAGSSPLAPPPLPVLPEWSPVTSAGPLPLRAAVGGGQSRRAERRTNAVARVAYTRISMTLRAAPASRCRTRMPSGARSAVRASRSKLPVSNLL